MKSNELKPCPFCGGKPNLFGIDYYWVQCNDCVAHTIGNEKVEKAIEAWNRRYEPRQEIDFDYAAED